MMEIYSFCLFFVSRIVWRAKPAAKIPSDNVCGRPLFCKYSSPYPLIFRSVLMAILFIVSSILMGGLAGQSVNVSVVSAFKHCFRLLLASLHVPCENDGMIQCSGRLLSLVFLISYVCCLQTFLYMNYQRASLQLLGHFF